MNIKVNYDLLEKLHEYKKGPVISKEILKFYNSPVMYGAVGIQIAYILASMNDKKALLGQCISSLVANTVVASAYCITNKVFSDNVKEKAKLNIQTLERELESNGIDSNLDDANLLKTKYKFKFVDKKPVINQKKYIEIPIIEDGYRISSDKKVIVQDHNIGSKEYELSEFKDDGKVSVFKKRR